MEKGQWKEKMVRLMRGITSKIKNTDMGFISKFFFYFKKIELISVMGMEGFMRVIGKMENRMERVFILIKRERRKEGFGNLERE